MARRTTIVFKALAAADTVLAATGRDRQRWLTKPWLMPALMAGRDRPTRSSWSRTPSWPWRSSAACTCPDMKGLVMATYATAQALLAGQAKP